MSTTNEAGEVAFSMDRAGRAAGNGYRVFSKVADWVTHERLELVNITDRVADIVRRSGIHDGIVHLQSLHTTTALFLNEWQDALLQDMKTFLAQVAPQAGDWRHNDPRYSDCERHNADSHLRGMLLGQTLALQVRNASVLIGTWQTIILAEFDGPRTRSVAVQVSGL